MVLRRCYFRSTKRLTRVPLFGRATTSLIPPSPLTTRTCRTRPSLVPEAAGPFSRVSCRREEGPLSRTHFDDELRLKYTTDWDTLEDNVSPMPSTPDSS